MLVGLFTYLSVRVWVEKRNAKQIIHNEKKLEKEIKQEFMEVKPGHIHSFFIVFASLAILAIGARLLIDGSVFLPIF